MKTKELKVAVTVGWHDLYGGIEGAMYIRMVTAHFEGDHPFQHFAFDYDAEKQEMVISVSGTNYKKNKHYVESKEIARFDSLRITPFWFIVDDCGDHYLGTFLLPSEY